MKFNQVTRSLAGAAALIVGSTLMMAPQAHATPSRPPTVVAAVANPTPSVTPASVQQLIRQTGSKNIIPPVEGNYVGPKAILRYTKTYVGLKWKAIPGAQGYVVKAYRGKYKPKDFSAGLFGGMLSVKIPYKSLPYAGKKYHGAYQFRVFQTNLWMQPIKTGRVAVPVSQSAYRAWVNPKAKGAAKKIKGITDACKRKGLGAAIATGVGGGILMGLALVFPVLEMVTVPIVLASMTATSGGAYVSCVVMSKI